MAAGGGPADGDAGLAALSARPALPLPPLHSPPTASSTPRQRASQALGNCRCVAAWHTGRNSRVQVHEAAVAAQHWAGPVLHSPGREQNMKRLHWQP
jgi:hypothetical protein